MTNKQMSAVETEAAELISQYEDGDIDNAWDVLPTLAELAEKLPEDSALRPEFDKMFSEIQDICRES